MLAAVFDAGSGPGPSETSWNGRARFPAGRRQLESMPPLQVAEIAHACGFDSIATFYRTFRQTYGMAPGDLRKIPPYR